MPVFKIHKTQNYTVMSNYHLRDERLSLKAVGLLSKVFSLPDDWVYSQAGLTSICKEGETAVKGALKELQKCGYLVVTKLFANETESRHIEYVYDFYEQPISIEKDKEKNRENRDEGQGVENPPVANRRLLNKEVLSKQEKTNTNETNPTNSRAKNFDFQNQGLENDSGSAKIISEISFEGVSNQGALLIAKVAWEFTKGQAKQDFATQLHFCKEYANNLCKETGCNAKCVRHCLEVLHKETRGLAAKGKTASYFILDNFEILKELCLEFREDYDIFDDI